MITKHAEPTRTHEHGILARKKSNDLISTPAVKAQEESKKKLFDHGLPDVGLQSKR